MNSFDVLGDPVRRRILELLAGGELTSGDISHTIQQEFGISQPAVSQHLRVLRETGMAQARHEGTRRLYTVRPDALQEVDLWLDRFRRFWSPPPDALATELAPGRRNVARQVNATGAQGTQHSVPRPGDRWRRALVETAVPQAIVDRAPEPEVSLEPPRFRWRPEEDATQPVRPSRRRALEALPDGGSVLDVGVGGGASSLGLVPKAGLIVGVDPMEGMLESFQASARTAGVAVRAVLGTWPDVADQVDPADVAVCHHAMYRVAEIEDFVAALTARARHRVVVELSAHSPLAALDPLWKAIHGIDRPVFLVADEAQAVLVAMGLAVEREDMLLAPRVQDVTPELVAFSRRRLYVGPDRDAEIDDFLRHRQPEPHRVVALWWPGAA